MLHIICTSNTKEAAKWKKKIYINKIRRMTGNVFSRARGEFNIKINIEMMTVWNENKSIKNEWI